jgi:phosphodiesterase/alkaline phosphatase D-like protein
LVGEHDADWVRRELVQSEPGWVIVADDAVAGWLYTINIDGSDPTRLTNHSAVDVLPDW